MNVRATKCCTANTLRVVSVSDKIALITTTINDPVVLERHRELSADVMIIVAGDKKGPVDDIARRVDKVGGMYLTPAMQDRWQCSEPIGWGKIQRRNIAILEAIRLGADVIVSVDDDNIPVDDRYYDQITELLLASPERRLSRSNPTGWSNPTGQLTPPGAHPIFHRGLPYSQRCPALRIVERIDYSTDRIGVAAGFWSGDPDIDALDRIHDHPEVREPFFPEVYNGFTMAPRTWAPFNSQNTAYLTKLAPLMMCWPFVGRYDDIWASYLARSMMDQLDYVVHYGQPIVHQERNEHNLWDDLEAEILGYRHTDELCDVLRKIKYNPVHTGNENLALAYKEIVKLPFIPKSLNVVFHMWLQDVATAFRERGNDGS